MVTSKLFMNNVTQAVRLPKEVAFSSDVHEVDIIMQGEARVIVPKGLLLQWWVKYAPRLSDDFSTEPDLPEPPIRDVVWPE